MGKQMNRPHQEPAAALEERVRRLEVRTAALADALRALVGGLEDNPLAEPGEKSAAEAARRAHELLLAAEAGSGANPGEG
jgi:exonuclease VII small subunit